MVSYHAEKKMKSDTSPESVVHSGTLRVWTDGRRGVQKMQTDDGGMDWGEYPWDSVAVEGGDLILIWGKKEAGATMLTIGWYAGVFVLPEIVTESLKSFLGRKVALEIPRGSRGICPGRDYPPLFGVLTPCRPG